MCVRAVHLHMRSNQDQQHEHRTGGAGDRGLTRDGR
jgi:hypothetical protein